MTWLYFVLVQSVFVFVGQTLTIDITRVESLRYGIEEAGITEGLDRLMVKNYGELRDVWRFYVSVGRTKRGADGEARLSMLQFARFTIDVGVIRKIDVQESGVLTLADAEGAETDTVKARKSTMNAKAADLSLLSGGTKFAPNADNQLSAALAGTTERSAAVAEAKSAADDDNAAAAAAAAAAGDDAGGSTMSSSSAKIPPMTSNDTTTNTKRLSQSLRRSARGKDGYIALADADRLYAVVTLRWGPRTSRIHPFVTHSSKPPGLATQPLLLQCMPALPGLYLG
jgi:hypothetical protein